MKYRGVFFGIFVSLMIFSSSRGFAQRPSSKRLILVLDATYTMRENNSLELAKSWATKAIEHFNTGDSLCVISFGNRARVLVPFLPVQSRQVMINAVANLAPRLATYILDGVSLAFKVHNWKNADQTRRTVIVFITDGLAPNDNRLDAIASEIDSANCVLYVVQTIRTGLDYENQLRTLAENSGGAFLDGTNFGPERIIPLIRN